ncbi:hypothetical protein [Peptoniphilus lacydonensis]|uniref:hypothetical protein n=1 Tax=Peptoniphilus lacydonensis TaxID=1673725 RepID=UPI00131CED12|nr:hypothetical protein [Peptoniphilus lacydonensis]
MEIINTRTDHCHEIVVPKHSYHTFYDPDENYGHCHEIRIGKHRFVDLKKEVENDEFK